MPRKRVSGSTSREVCTELTEVDDASLGGVVRSLHLREVDNVAAHRSSSDKAAVGEVGELVAVDIGALLLLSPPVGGGGLAAVEDSVEVNADHIAVVVQRPVDHRTLDPGNTGVGNENIQAAVEVLDDGDDGLLNGLRIGDIDLVSFG